MRAGTVLALIALTACTTPPPRAGMPTGQPSLPTAVRIAIRQNGRIAVQQVPLETYVEGTVLSEFAPPSGDTRVVEAMLEVQAVISRTYALAHLSRHAADGFDLCATTHCQLYEPGRLRTSRWATLARQAVAGTAARVLWFDGAPAAALFHADCGGATASAVDVWGGTSYPYLVGAPDDGPATIAHTAWTFEATIRQLHEALASDPRSDVGSRFDGLTVLDRDPSGRAERVAIQGAHDRVMTGEQLRQVLTGRFGAQSLKSTMFSVRRDGEVMHFDGHGFGHGVGLCQAGALARLRAGASVHAVLYRYFPGTSLVTLH